MTNLKVLFDKIKHLSKSLDPNIEYVVYGDVYELNHIQNVTYPAVVVTVGQHTSDLDNYNFNYKLNIFYVDRLTDDKVNKIDVHANAIIFINSLLKALDDEYIISDYEIYNFNERFNDVCAGAYVSCRIQMPISECYDFPGGDGKTHEIISNIEDINITENGVYSAPYGTAYKNVDVNVQYEIKDEYFRKIIEGRLDEPLVVPSDTTGIRAHAFEYLNVKHLSTDVVCPLLELPEGNEIFIGDSAFQYARIKKIVVPSDNRLNGTYIFANNKVLEELIWKSNSAALYMCSECSNLKTVVFSGSSPIISSNAFLNCTSLKSVDLSECTSVANLSSTTAFDGVPTTCEFRIPAALYDEWINATNWAALYAQGYKFISV